MSRYAALLRGVSPMNCKMPDLKRTLEATGFTNVVTVLSSGNAVCNTNKSAPALNGQKCSPDSPKSAWKTCSINTEPAGAFPKCRSRFGVFDQHGNLAEIMTGHDPKDGLVSQLKGSAFFYADAARSHDGKPSPRATHETYPGHCAHDPR